MSIKSFGERIADVLIEDGLLLPAQLTEAVELQKKQGGRLLKILTDKQYVTEQDMVISMGRCLDTPPINLAKLRVPEEIQNLVPKDMARAYKLSPIAKLGNKLFVAMADPLNVLALDDLRQRTKLEIIPMITTERAVAEALSGVGTATASMDQVMAEAVQESISDVEEVGTKKEDIDLDRLAVSGEDAPVVKIVNLILVQALKEKASDIHIEPFDKQLKLRYRIDGNLMEATSPPKALQMPIASRIKILSGLDIAERRLPQDGRFRIRVSGKEVDLRISILPTVHGEKIVIRILDKGALSGSVDHLGFDEYTLGVFKKAVDAPHGMILVTGPTGSGKTTTLYSVLSELNSPEYNIVTVEDPIEYQLPGINQVAVRSEIGLGFADALRSILRQDPDIVMIGEIRDNETADIAVKAALTGHQVLSTLHTNDAAGAITRLDDMGIEPFLISSSVILTCAQRLVRRICSNCKEEFIPDPEIFEKLAVDDMAGVPFFKGAGCERCKRRGYLGRAAVLEVLPISEQIRRLVIKRASAAVIKNQAVTEGMKTLRIAGIDKAREGITSLEEVLRVTSEDH
jgi:type IV pilus assembly protein PilB